MLRSESARYGRSCMSSVCPRPDSRCQLQRLFALRDPQLEIVALASSCRSRADLDDVDPTSSVPSTRATASPAHREVRRTNRTNVVFGANAPPGVNAPASGLGRILVVHPARPVIVSPTCSPGPCVPAAVALYGRKSSFRQRLACPLGWCPGAGVMHIAQEHTR